MQLGSCKPFAPEQQQYRGNKRWVIVDIRKLAFVSILVFVSAPSPHGVSLLWRPASRRHTMDSWTLIFCSIFFLLLLPRGHGESLSCRGWKGSFLPAKESPPFREGSLEISPQQTPQKAVRAKTQDYLRILYVCFLAHPGSHRQTQLQH